MESRLIVRLHCKHGKFTFVLTIIKFIASRLAASSRFHRLNVPHYTGVVKTHRLPLNPASMLNSPTMTDPNSESQLSVEPKMLKSLLEQFPFSKGSKTDPQLIWQFKFNEVKLRSIETSVDAKGMALDTFSGILPLAYKTDCTIGRPQLMTDLTINPEEFDNYDMLSEHITIAFHLREFNVRCILTAPVICFNDPQSQAVITFAETSQRSITMRFTDNAEPLYMTTIGGEDPVETLFVVATTQVQSASQPNSQANQRDATPGLRANARKRPLDGDDGPQVRMADGPVHFNDRPKRPMKVVQRTDRQSMAREMNPQLAAAAPDDEPQPSWAVLSAAQQPSQGIQYQYDGDFGGAGPSNLSLPGVARARARTPPHEREPLFLPGSQLSQLPPDQRAAIIDSGLGIENMTMEEFEAMLDGEAEEVEFGEDGADEEVAWPVDDGLDFRGYSAGRQDSLELVDDIEMAPTQPGSGGKVNPCDLCPSRGTTVLTCRRPPQVFRPLFED